MVINYVLAQGGLKPTDVAIIGVGAGATVIAAIEQGRVDVVSQTDPAVTMLEKDGKVKVIAETRTPRGHAEALRRADAGRQPVCADRVHQARTRIRCRR